MLTANELIHLKELYADPFANKVVPALVCNERVI